MPAYVVVNVTVTDPQRYPEYILLAPPTIAKYGGRYLARAGRSERLEGVAEPQRFVILEFPSYERAKEWWSSAEYAAPKALRQRTASTEMILVEGL